MRKSGSGDTRLVRVNPDTSSVGPSLRWPRKGIELPEWIESSAGGKSPNLDIP